jgi:hypothetical protein
MFGSVMEVYDLTEQAISLCRSQGKPELAAQLERALGLGSSPLEILGAIRAAFVQNSQTLEGMLGQSAVADVVAFVDKAYGR